MGDDDRQSRAFIFSEWKSGCVRQPMPVGMEGVRAKGDGDEVGEEVTGRKADGGNALEIFCEMLAQEKKKKKKRKINFRLLNLNRLYFCNTIMTRDGNSTYVLYLSRIMNICANILW